MIGSFVIRNWEREFFSDLSRASIDLLVFMVRGLRFSIGQLARPLIVSSNRFNSMVRLFPFGERYARTSLVFTGVRVRSENALFRWVTLEITGLMSCLDSASRGIWSLIACFRDKWRWKTQSKISAFVRICTIFWLTRIYIIKREKLLLYNSSMQLVCISRANVFRIKRFDEYVLF